MAKCVFWKTTLVQVESGTCEEAVVIQVGRAEERCENNVVTGCREGWESGGEGGCADEGGWRSKMGGEKPRPFVLEPLSLWILLLDLWGSLGQKTAVLRFPGP